MVPSSGHSPRPYNFAVPPLEVGCTSPSSTLGSSRGPVWLMGYGQMYHKHRLVGSQACAPDLSHDHEKAATLQVASISKRIQLGATIPKSSALIRQPKIREQWEIRNSYQSQNLEMVYFAAVLWHEVTGTFAAIESHNALFLFVIV